MGNLADTLLLENWRDVEDFRKGDSKK